MESLFREHFEAPRRPSVAADGCEIIQRAFSAPSAPACPWLCSKADTDLGDYCTDGDLQTNEIVSGAAPSVQASAGRQQRPMAPVPLSDFSRARAFHPPAPAAASQAFPPPAPRMKSARGFSPNPPWHAKSRELLLRCQSQQAPAPSPASNLSPPRRRGARASPTPPCLAARLAHPPAGVLGEHQAPPCPNPATCRGSQPLAGCPG